MMPGVQIIVLTTRDGLQNIQSCIDLQFKTPEL